MSLPRNISNGSLQGLVYTSFYTEIDVAKRYCDTCVVAGYQSVANQRYVPPRDVPPIQPISHRSNEI
jgi:hypothetical protein